IQHPDLEALFTIDEETGMTGAFGLKGGVLNGKILLNLDTENDTEIDIGCAGGLDVTATRTYKPEKLDHSDCIGLQIGIKGLQGGHSGVDIHLGRGNANKLLNRILYNATSAGMRLASFDGGSLRNAIPREASAIAAVTTENKEKVLAQIHKDMDYIRKEYQSIESHIELYVNELYQKSTFSSRSATNARCYLHCT
ncbi:MAG: peptidase dimerization domain-containing protein, partial [Chitinophagales bacterium]|nr:peptidase dimerization domain-containing protein [Chitinophagales bacterium]